MPRKQTAKFNFHLMIEDLGICRENVDGEREEAEPSRTGPRYLVDKKISLWQASYDMRWAERLIPNFSILCRSVFGCIPRVFAAPFAPSITPRVCCSTAEM